MSENQEYNISEYLENIFQNIKKTIFLNIKKKISQNINVTIF